MKSQPQLFKQTKPEQKPQKKDLTSTLMTKNLSNMTSTNNGAGFGTFGTGNMSGNMTAGNMMGSSSFGNISSMSGSNIGNMGNSIGSMGNGNMGMNSMGMGNNSMGGGIRPLSNQPAIMPSNMSTSASFGNGFNQPMMSNPMGQSMGAPRPMATNQNSGWTLQNPMTPQGVTIPTNNTPTGAKKLTAAELADFLG